MKVIFNSDGFSQKDEILNFIRNFRSSGTYLNKGRNSIKLFPLGEKTVNIKSFKIPNAVNKVAYKFFRKSKAERSYTYAQHLLSKGIGTPYPIAYAEETSPLAFGSSFYISEHLDYDLTYRELVQEPGLQHHEEILRAFTRFTYKLHEEGVEFLDHSPGNTLIQLNGGEYLFYLVDLNRMNFKEMDFEDRIKNFSRLTPKKEMVKVMANEYAALINRPETEVFEKMWFYTRKFQEKFFRKKRLKKKLKFWKR